MAGWGEREERRTRDLLLVVSWKTPEEDVGAGEGKVEMGRWGEWAWGFGQSCFRAGWGVHGWRMQLEVSQQGCRGECFWALAPVLGD